MKGLMPGSSSSGGDTMEEMGCDCKLTRTQRLYGFITCFVLGYIICFMSSLTLIGGDSESISNFAVLYVVGNLIAIAGSGFLVGPCKQLKTMFKEKRRVACCIWLLMLVVVLVAAAMGAHPVLVIFLLMIQGCAAIWYSASYIPYGRDMIKNFLKSCCKCG